MEIWYSWELIHGIAERLTYLLSLVVYSNGDVYYCRLGEDELEIWLIPEWSLGHSKVVHIVPVEVLSMEQIAKCYYINDGSVIETYKYLAHIIGEEYLGESEWNSRGISIG